MAFLGPLLGPIPQGPEYIFFPTLTENSPTKVIISVRLQNIQGKTLHTPKLLTMSPSNRLLKVKRIKASEF